MILNYGERGRQSASVSVRKSERVWVCLSERECEREEGVSTTAEDISKVKKLCCSAKFFWLFVQSQYHRFCWAPDMKQLRQLPCWDSSVGSDLRLASRQGSCSSMSHHSKRLIRWKLLESLNIWKDVKCFTTAPAGLTAWLCSSRCFKPAQAPTWPRETSSPAQTSSALRSTASTWTSTEVSGQPFSRQGFEPSTTTS